MEVFKSRSSKPDIAADRWLYRFGELLAYCYHFGIQDIHWQNILVGERDLQVIDVEQVFSDLMLPNQTLMLPTENLLRASAAINLLTPDDLELFDQAGASELFEGFNHISDLIWSSQAQIQECFERFMPQILETPNRVFFRRTKDYVEHLNGTQKLTDLFDEEQRQIDRGDVPYFFMMIGGSEIYSYADKNWAQNVVDVPVLFQKYSNYASYLPQMILQEPVIEAKWARGALYLLHKLSALAGKTFRTQNCAVGSDGNRFRFDGPTQSFFTKAL